jgi:hypothetical protein
MPVSAVTLLVAQDLAKVLGFGAALLLLATRSSTALGLVLCAGAVTHALMCCVGHLLLGGGCVIASCTFFLMCRPA